MASSVGSCKAPLGGPPSPWRSDSTGDWGSEGLTRPSGSMKEYETEQKASNTKSPLESDVFGPHMRWCGRLGSPKAKSKNIVSTVTSTENEQNQVQNPSPASKDRFPWEHACAMSRKELFWRAWPCFDTYETSDPRRPHHSKLSPCQAEWPFC